METTRLVIVAVVTVVAVVVVVVVAVVVVVVVVVVVAAVAVVVSVVATFVVFESGEVFFVVRSRARMVLVVSIAAIFEEDRVVYFALNEREGVFGRDVHSLEALRIVHAEGEAGEGSYRVVVDGWLLMGGC